MNAKQLLIVTLGSTWFGVAQAQAQTAKPGASAPNDAQIADVVVVANQADVDAGKLARTHSKDPAVKQFADTMIRDHEAANKQAKALVRKLGVKPEPSDTSRSLRKEDKENLAALKALEGSAFDKAYVEHEVAYHEQVIDAVKSTLLPNAKNPQLKALIEKDAPVFEAHLQHAKQLQSRLASAGSSSGGSTGSGTSQDTGGSKK